MSVTSALPLDAFFDVLRREGITVGTRDYARMRMVFSAQTDWTLESIRNALRSLLIHDRRLVSTYDRTFDEFFSVSRSDVEIPPIVLARALRELAAVEWAPPTDPVRLAAAAEGSSAPDPAARRSQWLAGIGRILNSRLLPVCVSTVVLCVTAAVMYSTGRETAGYVPPMAYSIEAEVFGFTEQAPFLADGSIVNNAAEALRLRPGFSGIDRAQFRVSLPDEFTLESGEVRQFTVQYQPDAEDEPSEAAIEQGRTALIFREVETNQIVARGNASLDVELTPYEPAVPSVNFTQTTDRGPQFEINFIPHEIDDSWKAHHYWGLACLVCMAFTAGWMAYLNWWAKPPGEAPFKWRENAPGERFSLAWVGGTQGPLLNDRQAKRLGDLLGFFRTEHVGRELDVDRSVRSTIDRGGIPDLHYRHLVSTRRVVILEDELIHPDFRSSIVDDLCLGLDRTGVSYLRARFHETLDEFTDNSGAGWELLDFRNERDSYVFLIFSDGSGFRRRVSQQSLQRLSEWPRVGWIDVREPLFREDRCELPRKLGLPVFSATIDGLTLALRAFLVEGRRMADDEARQEHRVQRQSGQTGLANRVDSLLGEAILWAGDCSFLQPCSAALAERLREEFHPHLSPTRIQRLYRLPGARRDAVGLSFDPQTLAVLRSHWQSARPAKAESETAGEPESQETVLSFIRMELDAVRPEELEENTNRKQKSLAMLSWEAASEFLRLEQDETCNAKALTQVAGTPAGRYVKSRLQAFQVSDVEEDDIDPSRPVRLRLPIRDPRARQRLAATDARVGVRRADFIHLLRFHWTILSLCLTATVLCGFMAIPPNEPGALLVTAAGPPKQIFDAAPTNSEVALAISPSGEVIAAVNTAGNIVLLTPDGETIKELTPDGETIKGLDVETPTWLSFSPDGDSIALAYADAIRLLDLRGRKLWARDLASDNSDFFRTVAFSPDGRFVATGNDDGTVQIWKMDGSPHYYPSSRGESQYDFSYVAFSPAEPLLVSSHTFEPQVDELAFRSTIQFWHLDGSPRGKTVESAGIWPAFTQDGSTLVVATHDGKVGFLKVSGTRMSHALRGHPMPLVLGATVANGGRIVATSSLLRPRVFMWDLAERRLMSVTPDIGTDTGESFDLDTVLRSEFLPNGHQLVCVTDDDGVYKIELLRQELRRPALWSVSGLGVPAGMTAQELLTVVDEESDLPAVAVGPSHVELLIRGSHDQTFELVGTWASAEWNRFFPLRTPGATYQVRIAGVHADFQAESDTNSHIVDVSVLDKPRERTPNDPRFSEQWTLASINAPKAWSVTTGSRDVTVAVIGTGIDYSHEDFMDDQFGLEDNIWSNSGELPDNGKDDDENGYIDDVHGFDFVDRDGAPFDDHGNGTHCAGVIGAFGNNGTGIAGVNWKVKLMALRVLGGTSARGEWNDVTESIDYAVENGADIICAPLGGIFPAGLNDRRIADAFRRAQEKGILVVVAAGNNNNDVDGAPLAADMPENLIIVAATNPDDSRPYYSSVGLKTVAIGAPGGDADELLLTTSPSHGYSSSFGTSFSACYVAGAAALVMSHPQYVDADWREVKRLLLENARPVEGLKALWGHTKPAVPGGVLDLSFLGRTRPPSPDVRIASALPNPTGNDAGRETVTLTNTGRLSAELDGWKLLNRSGRSYTLSGSLAAGESLELTLAGTLTLDNRGDDVLLLDVTGQLQDEVTYTAADARTGQSVTFQE